MFTVEENKLKLKITKTQNTPYELLFDTIHENETTILFSTVIMRDFNNLAQSNLSTVMKERKLLLDVSLYWPKTKNDLLLNSRTSDLKLRSLVNVLPMCNEVIIGDGVWDLYHRLCALCDSIYIE